jgi:hypothetical protein
MISGPIVVAAGDPELSRRLDGLFARQQMTFDRRFGRMAGATK